jgi:hypothetical protein
VSELAGNEWIARPSVLEAVLAPKPWGWELWLTSTRPEAPAGVRHPGTTLADLVAAHPEVLGVWARRLFGDQMPIFAKLIHTDFPPRVHIGFRRKVERGELLAWLDREQDLMRRLLPALRIPDAGAFAAYHARYSSWATEQALAGWHRDDDATTVAALRDFVDPALDLAAWLRAVRANRSVIAGSLGEIDLRDEAGNFLLSPAGIVHAIFGLSLQTHPLDRTRVVLQELFAELAERAAAGASEEELGSAIDAAGLPALRGGNLAPPKNEAWSPATIDGAEILVEPQQTSDTTYSLADFYTPLTWGGDRARFRKGAPAHGLSHEELSSYVADLSVEATPVEAIRRSPQEVGGASRADAELYRLVDEPSHWPFFTVYQLELSGTFTARPPAGTFEQIVVTRGRVALGDKAGVVGEMSSRAPGFVPATLEGPYTLTAREPSTVLFFAVPGARGGAPRL